MTIREKGGKWHKDFLFIDVEKMKGSQVPNHKKDKLW